jgi:hypothetical protein
VSALLAENGQANRRLNPGKWIPLLSANSNAIAQHAQKAHDAQATSTPINEVGRAAMLEVFEAVVSEAAVLEAVDAGAEGLWGKPKVNWRPIRRHRRSYEGVLIATDCGAARQAEFLCARNVSLKQPKSRLIIFARKQ